MQTASANRMAFTALIMSDCPSKASKLRPSDEPGACRVAEFETHSVKAWPVQVPWRLAFIVF